MTKVTTHTKSITLQSCVFTHLAWPIWASSYTVGPQLYHSTLRPYCGI